MPITRQRLESLFARIGSNFRFDPTPGRELFEARYPTRHYESPSGSKSITVMAKILDEGTVAQFVCPEVYDLGKTPHRSAAFEAVMQLAWSTKALAFECDASTQKLWITADIIVEDSALTATQVERIICSLIDTVDEYHPVLRHAIDTGVIDFTRAGKESAAQPEATEVEQLIKQLGGADKIRKMLDEREGAEAGKP
jgi:hypothetical protein